MRLEGSTASGQSIDGSSAGSPGPGTSSPIATFNDEGGYFQSVHGQYAHSNIGIDQLPSPGIPDGYFRTPGGTLHLMSKRGSFQSGQGSPGHPGMLRGDSYPGPVPTLRNQLPQRQQMPTYSSAPQLQFPYVAVSPGSSQQPFLPSEGWNNEIGHVQGWIEEDQGEPEAGLQHPQWQVRFDPPGEGSR
jgi:hypothetical protein